MKIGVILGSIRKIRRGQRVAQWLMGRLQDYKEAEFELLDLRDYPLPFFEEDNSPDCLENCYQTPGAQKWAEKIGEKDGFIIITAEYNHGPTAVLKNAMDYVYTQWIKKPVMFVGYATGSSGAMRAVEQLRLISIELQMVPMQAAIHITNVLKTLDEKGNLLAGHYNERVIVVMKQFMWWAKALKKARDEDSEKENLEDNPDTA